MRFPPNTDPRTFATIAFIIGLVLMDDFTVNEQNSIGNRLILVGQVLEVTSSQQSVIEERIKGNTININRKEYKETGDPLMHNPSLYDNLNFNPNDIILIKQALNKMQQEIDNLIKKSK